MSRSLSLVASLVALFSIVACGQKGALYLPQPTSNDTALTAVAIDSTLSATAAMPQYNHS